MTDLTGFHHVSMTVSDLERSVEWYEQVLGLHVLFREEAETRRAAVMAFADGSYAVGLTAHEGDPSRFDATRIGLDHLAVTVASEESLAEWADRLTAHGVDHSGAIPIPPGAILNFKDPDGIALALFWDRG